ncbi:MAG: hypothetical protein WDM84_05725 [Bauldia sp.]
MPVADALSAGSQDGDFVSEIREAGAMSKAPERFLPRAHRFMHEHPTFTPMLVLLISIAGSASSSAAASSRRSIFH